MFLLLYAPPWPHHMRRSSTPFSWHHAAVLSSISMSGRSLVCGRGAPVSGELACSCVGVSEAEAEACIGPRVVPDWQRLIQASIAARSYVKPSAGGGGGAHAKLVTARAHTSQG